MRTIKSLTILLALLFAGLAARAQYTSDYTVVTGDPEQKTVWKGACTFDDLNKVSDFKLQEASAVYKPEISVIKQLSKQLEGCEVIIFLGTWCEDSHRIIPQLYRVLKDTGYPFDKLRMIALDRDKKSGGDLEKKCNVTHVPAIIVMKDGMEKGRITETVESTVEGDLLHITRP